MPELRQMTEQTDWHAKQQSQVACVLEELMCWGAWDTISRHKAKDIIYMINCLGKRGIDIANTQRSSLKGWERVTINQMNTGTGSKPMLENFYKMEWDFLTALKDTILNWPKLYTWPWKSWNNLKSYLPHILILPVKDWAPSAHISMVLLELDTTRRQVFQRN